MLPNSYARAVKLCVVFLNWQTAFLKLRPRLFQGLPDPSVVYCDSFSKLWKEELCNREIEELLFLRNRGRQREKEKEREGGE